MQESGFDPTSRKPAADPVLEAEPPGLRAAVADRRFGPSAEVEAEFQDAYRTLAKINKQLRDLRPRRNGAKRRLLICAKRLRETCGDPSEFVHRIMAVVRCGRSQAHNIAGALDLAERAQLLTAPPEWNEQHAHEPFEQSPIPDLANMAAAEQIFGERQLPHYPRLQAAWIKMAKEGRLPSKRQMARARQNRHPINVQLDCRAKFMEPDVDEEIVSRETLRCVFHCLARLEKAGSESCRRTLTELRARLNAAAAERLAGRKPEAIEIVIKGRIAFRLAPTKPGRPEEEPHSILAGDGSNLDF